MEFGRPWALLLLCAGPLALAGHLWLRRRRRKVALRFSSLSLIREALPRRSAWRRHVPVGLFVGGLLGLGVAGAQPTASSTVPLSRTTIVLALDVSRSMCTTDVDPNRLSVAQDAARRFVERQDDGTRIGLVAFSGFASQVVAPTTDDDELLAAIDGLTTARGTAIGMAILASIDTVAEINPDVAPTGVDLGDGPDPEAGAGPGATAGDAPDATGAGGEYVPDIVVLLTDGANTQGTDPVVAAEEAAARGLRVYTIGFGTTDPAPAVCTPAQLGADAVPGSFGVPGAGDPTVGNFDPGAAGGGVAPRRYRELDEETLTAVADMTGGTYHRAEEADQLREIFDSLPSQIELQHEEREVTVWFTLAGVALAVAALTLSLLWNRLPSSA